MYFLKRVVVTTKQNEVNLLPPHEHILDPEVLQRDQRKVKILEKVEAEVEAVLEVEVTAGAEVVSVSCFNFCSLINPGCGFFNL